MLHRVIATTDRILRVFGNAKRTIRTTLMSTALDDRGGHLAFAIDGHRIAILTSTHGIIVFRLFKHCS